MSYNGRNLSHSSRGEEVHVVSISSCPIGAIFWIMDDT